MKKTWEQPKMEIIMLDEADFIRTSGEYELPKLDDLPMD